MECIGLAYWLLRDSFAPVFEGQKFRRRERIFWLVVGAMLVVGFIALIPAHGEICKESQKAGEEACTSYRLVPFLVIEIGKILDSLGVAVTALATIAIAWFTLSLRRSTDRLWNAGEKQRLSAEGIAKRQSNDMQKSISAANRSAAVAENALIAADRAWISIDAKIIGLLTFDQDVVSLNVEFKMTNVGKSPATHVELFAMLSPDIIAARNMGDEAMEMLNTQIFDFGVVLFPEKTNSRDLPIGMKIADFKKNIVDSAKIVTERGSPGDVPREVARPAIMACASYRLAGSRKRRHTVILFEVRHANEMHFGWDGSASEIPSDHLRLVQTFMSGQVT